MYRVFVSFLLIFLTSCTSVELAANLGKKAFIKSESKKVSKATYKIGKPYIIENKTYYPKKNLNYNEKGIASWYGPKFHGKLTANGEIFNQYELTAAHKTLPLPSAVKVTNLKNNLSVIVRINDRGPFVNDRIIDLSYESAKKIKLLNTGTGYVKVQLLRSESILLEKLAKKGQFPEISKILKKTIPPIKQANYSNVSIKKITSENNNFFNKDQKINKRLRKDIDNIEKKVQLMRINQKKFKIWIQIASFSTSKSAKLLKSKFKSLNNISINKVNINGKNFYRVRVGPYYNVRESQQTFNFLINRGMEGTRLFVE